MTPGFKPFTLEDDLPGCHKEPVPGQFQRLKKSLPLLAQTMMQGLF